MKKRFIILCLLIGLTAGTEYQEGVSQGLWVGLHMGELLGMAQGGNLTAAEEYNNMLQKYHAGLIEIFGDNLTILEVFSLPRIEMPSVSPGADPLSINRTKTREIGANAGGITIPQPDETGRVHGIPYDAYLMMGPSHDDLKGIRSKQDIGALGGV
jgi:hypothetical protein